MKQQTILETGPKTTICLRTLKEEKIVIPTLPLIRKRLFILSGFLSKLVEKEAWQIEQPACS